MVSLFLLVRLTQIDREALMTSGKKNDINYPIKLYKF